MKIKVCVLLVLVSTASVQAQNGGKNQFDRWDRNQDGKLVREELPAALRKNFDRVDRDRDGFISRDEDRAFWRRATNVKELLNQPYADNGNPRQQLDLFLPRKRNMDRLPVVVFIHGGAWRAGSKRSGRGRVLPYVESGDYVGVSVGYRLSSEAKWPAQIADCKAAIRWLRAHEKQYGLDTERIAVWGSSAGGHLVAMLGVTGDVKLLEGRVGKHLEHSSRVRCVVDYYGPTDLLSMNDFPSRIDHNAANSPESQLIGGALQKNKKKSRHASPTSYVSKTDPPFLIVHGTKDMLVPFNQSERFHKALRDAGATSTLIKIEGGGHGGFRDPTLTPRVDAFLKKHLWDSHDKTRNRDAKKGGRE